MGFRSFPQIISLKVNIIARLELEIAYQDCPLSSALATTAGDLSIFLGVSKLTTDKTSNIFFFNNRNYWCHEIFLKQTRLDYLN